MSVSFQNAKGFLQEVTKRFPLPIQLYTQDGDDVHEVGRGTGISIRQHDDVMLSKGYSNKVTQIVDIPAGDFLVITLETDGTFSHHAEQRFVESYNGILEVKVITGLVEVDLPTSEGQIPAFNQKTAALNPDVKSIFKYRGIHSSNPITGTVDDNNTMDQFHLHAVSGNARQAGEADSSSVQGRYYNNGLWTVLVHNSSNTTVEFTYIYSWHEF